MSPHLGRFLPASLRDPRQLRNSYAISVGNDEVAVAGAGAWQSGSSIAASQPLHHVSIVANAVRGATEGIRFSGTGFQRTPACALNRLEVGISQPLVGRAGLPEDAVVGGEAVSRAAALRERSAIAAAGPVGRPAGRCGAQACARGLGTAGRYGVPAWPEAGQPVRWP